MFDIFKKLFRRSGIDIEYTKGFSPHQIMSFAAPLGVGLTSEGEYVDIQLLSSDAPEVMLERINAVLTEGFRVIDFHTLLEAEPQMKVVTAMSLVASADYLVSLKDGYQISNSIVTQEDFKKAFLIFFEKQEIIIGKKTKKSDKEVDIKPMISRIAFDQKKESINRLTGYELERVAEVYENGIKIYMQLDTGSSSNLKPELVMEAFYEELGIPMEQFSWQVHRLEVYTRDAITDIIAPLNHVDR